MSNEYFYCEKCKAQIDQCDVRIEDGLYVCEGCSTEKRDEDVRDLDSFSCDTYPDSDQKYHL